MNAVARGLLAPGRFPDHRGGRIERIELTEAEQHELKVLDQTRIRLWRDMMQALETPGLDAARAAWDAFFKEYAGLERAWVVYNEPQAKLVPLLGWVQAAWRDAQGGDREAQWAADYLTARLVERLQALES